MNSPPHPSTVSRRGFFTAVGRSAALMTLAAFAGWQELKRHRLANDPNCLKLATCSSCAEFGRCSQPRATAELRAARSNYPPP